MVDFKKYFEELKDERVDILKEHQNKKQEDIEESKSNDENN